MMDEVQSIDERRERLRRIADASGLVVGNVCLQCAS